MQSTLAAAWSQFPVVVITGARQVGKTTLARAFLPEADYVTLDLPANALTLTAFDPPLPPDLIHRRWG